MCRAIVAFCLRLRACLPRHREQISGTTFTFTLPTTEFPHGSELAAKMASTASLGRRLFSSSSLRILDNTPNRERIVVAMSGGVDSSVAAHLLRKSHPGADIIGLHVSCLRRRVNLACGVLFVDSSGILLVRSVISMESGRIHSMIFRNRSS